MLELNKIYNMNCIDGMNEMIMQNLKVDLFVTSPPYYNAREYSQWETVNDYMNDMKIIFTKAYQCLRNHKYIVVNVGNVTCQVGKAKWSVRKLPLAAMYTMMLEEIGFEFIDDFIWDKGEPQSKRHLGNPPYPFYQYPVNCYEHILIFAKHELDKTKIPCPDCNETIVVSNSQSRIGVQSWECKNPKCPTKSEHGRGKRFSERSIMTNDYQTEENYIEEEFVKKWRRDIVKINPVVKINCKGENIVGHTAPYPEDIPEMAIKCYTGVGDIVVDMFSGSGTTAIACINTNRNYIGFELDTTYYNLANERIQTHQINI